MANKEGAIRRTAVEWGKGRKQEAAERNLNNRARIESIAEQIRELTISGEEIYCPYCHGVGHDGRGTECGFCDNGIHTVGT